MREIKFRVWDPNVSIMYLNVGIDKISLYDFEGDNITEQEGLEVMQYTGLKDKNGTEIYEGDLLQMKCDFEHRKGTVIDVVEVWNCSFACGEWLFHEIIDNGAKGKQEFEVIGNIHSNPELLPK